jgi:hypothetical protein
MNSSHTGVDPIRWRVTAYAGELEYAGQQLPLLSTTEGEIETGRTSPQAWSQVERLLTSVRASLSKSSRCRRPSDLRIRTPHAMTVIFEYIASEPTGSTRSVARFDILMEENNICASFLAEGVPRFDVGALLLADEHEVWGTVQALLKAMFPSLPNVSPSAP